jgi:hypothetical protein
MVERVDSEGRVIRDDADVRDSVTITDKELRDAYDRGRRDEAARHHRNWLWVIVEALLALVGVIVLVLAALNGSFEGGGRVIDEQLSIARVQAGPTIRNAASDAGTAIQNARDNNNTNTNTSTYVAPATNTAPGATTTTSSTTTTTTNTQP